MLKSTIKLTTLIIFTSFLYSCESNQDKSSENNSEEEVLTEEIIEDDIDQTEYVLPSPLQIAELFKNAGLTYIGDLTNSIANVDNYNSRQDQKLNFGIYSADMAYCIMNNQTQESINYLNTLKKLSEKLWMTDVLNAIGLSSRLEGNVGNDDSLAYIMADMQMQMDDYLEENEMGHTGSIIFAGAWIETMYLGAKINEAERNEKLISRISEQVIILETIIASIKQNDNEHQFDSLITDLESINDHFKGFNSDNDEEFILSDKAVKNLSDDLTALRNKITGK